MARASSNAFIAHKNSNVASRVHESGSVHCSSRPRCTNTNRARKPLRLRPQYECSRFMSLREFASMPTTRLKARFSVANDTSLSLNNETTTHLERSTRTGPLAGKVAFVTGCDRGLGRHVLEALVKDGASVQMACIDMKSAASTQEEINKKYPGANVGLAPRLDLADMASVRAAADWFLSSKQPLHILVNNAGANFFQTPFYTGKGVGGCAQINFVGPYTLTRLLEPALTTGAEGARVINVASVMHRFTKWSTAEKFLKEWDAGGYRSAKLGMILFTKELQRRLGGEGVVAVAVDPGAVFSGIWDTSNAFGRPPISWLMRACYSPVEDGATISVWAATRPSNKEFVPGGYYARGLFTWNLLTVPPFKPGGVLHQLVGLICSLLDWPLRRLLRGALGTSAIKCVRSASATEDPDLAKDLWEVTAEVADMAS